MRLLLLRHAETEWTLTGQHTGKTDLHLTEAGREQARALAPTFRRLLGGRNPDVVYSSPRSRALETVLLAVGTEPAPIPTDLLAEVDYGDYEGLTPAEIQVRSPGWSFWIDRCPGGETMEDAVARADRFIDLLGTRHSSEVVCAASHGHMSRILTARILKLEGWQGRLLGIDTASIAEFADKNGALVLARWNVTS